MDLNATYPSRVHLTAHSMGNIVAGEALRPVPSGSPLVNTYIAMQAAVASHAYDPTTTIRPIPLLQDDCTPNRYAEYYSTGSDCYFHTSGGAANCVNFYNTNDYALAEAHWGLDQNLKPADTLDYGYHSGTGNFFHVLTGLTFPNDTYEIFSFCDEARCYALGAQYGVGGVFQAALEVELNDAPYNFGANHKFHSAQFRSTNMQRATFWQRVLIRFGLKED